MPGGQQIADLGTAAGSARGQPEVEELYAGLRPHDVPWLQIAVNDAAPVRLVESVCDLDQRADCFGNRNGATPDPLVQRLPFDVLHHEILRALVQAYVVKRADVWVVEAGDDFCLTLEPIAAVAIGSEMRRQDLDGDDAIQPRVARAVDLSH